MGAWSFPLLSWEVWATCHIFFQDIWVFMPSLSPRPFPCTYLEECHNFFQGACCYGFWCWGSNPEIQTFQTSVPPLSNIPKPLLIMFSFATGSHWVAWADIKLSLQPTHVLNLPPSCPSLPSTGITDLFLCFPNLLLCLRKDSYVFLVRKSAYCSPGHLIPLWFRWIIS